MVVVDLLVFLVLLVEVVPLLVSLALMEEVRPVLYRLGLVPLVAHLVPCTMFSPTLEQDFSEIKMGLADSLVLED